MWEIGLFKRLVPAFAVVLVGVIFYIMVKYVINGMFSAFNATGINPANWGLAYWIFSLMGIIVVWFYILKAWLIIKGRISSGMNEPRRPGRKPQQEEFPPEQNVPF